MGGWSLKRQVALEAGLVLLPAAHGGLSFQHVVLSGSAKRNGGEGGGERENGGAAHGALHRVPDRRQRAGAVRVHRWLRDRWTLDAAAWHAAPMSTAPHFPVDPQEFWRDPYPALAAMRREAPIC